jgi:hypothetical protein
VSALQRNTSGKGGCSDSQNWQSRSFAARKRTFATDEFQKVAVFDERLQFFRGAGLSIGTDIIQTLQLQLSAILNKSSPLITLQLIIFFGFGALKTV